jgi:hypothetical protein
MTQFRVWGWSLLLTAAAGHDPITTGAGRHPVDRGADYDPADGWGWS